MTNEAKTYVCIGNGIRAEGTPGEMNKAIIKTAIEDLLASKSEYQPIIIFSGGYRNPSGITEAHAMMHYASRHYPAYKNFFFSEPDSYRTHNNAIETMKMIARNGIPGELVTICDHPLHLPRTLLAFRIVARLYHPHIRLKFVGLPSREVYDAEIPGQPQWVNRKSILAHERKGMILYKILLSWPWARLGLWFLRKIWPSYKQ